ncbi:MAG: hypothetical protein GY717_11155 [Rhodobacteraceae bacterium]|nr:hypothetical protein [Paracoccaceae bacterium]
MSFSSGFLGGAKDRLLPVSIPFRFFLSAAVFHLLAWAALFWAADEVAGFAGGAGPVLAAIHLATLGVFAMTAIGASFQLLPVVTRQPLARIWPAKVSFWLLLPGICLLTWGMAVYLPTAMQAGAVLVTAGFTAFALLTVDNLRRAGSMLVVAAHGWAVLAALAVLVVLGLLLVWDMTGGFLDDRYSLAILHAVLASFGFMGLLVLGLSLVLIPMFVLARSPAARLGWLQLALAVLALAGFSAGVLADVPALLWVSLLAGFGAAAVYLWQMLKALRSSMRKRLGLSFWLIRASWSLLLVCLTLGGVLIADIAIPNAPALFGFVLLAGWQLTFLTGVLQRIMPFLASMHAAGPSGLPPLLSELTAEGPLKVHAVCHGLALLFCAAGIALDQAVLVRLGAGSGVLGAAAFGAFSVTVLRKLAKSRPRG